MTVKDNQKTLKRDIMALDLMKSPCEFETIGKAHGRTEVRRIWTSTAINEYVNFPHVKQVFVIERNVHFNKTGKKRYEIAYGVTSLSAEQATPEQLLSYNRNHWGIENRSHYVRDWDYDEDRCQIRTNKGPQMMACLRNFAISLLRLLGTSNVAQSLRHYARRPAQVMAVLGL